MGIIFKAPAAVLYVLSSIYALFITFSIVQEAIGTFFTFVAMLILPVFFTLAPFYALFAKGQWLPIILVYGSGAVCWILFAIGEAIDRR